MTHGFPQNLHVCFGVLKCLIYLACFFASLHAVHNILTLASHHSTRHTLHTFTGIPFNNFRLLCCLYGSIPRDTKLSQTDLRIFCLVSGVWTLFLLLYFAAHDFEQNNRVESKVSNSIEQNLHDLIMTNSDLDYLELVYIKSIFYIRAKLEAGGGIEPLTFRLPWISSPITLHCEAPALYIFSNQTFKQLFDCYETNI